VQTKSSSQVSPIFSKNPQFFSTSSELKMKTNITKIILSLFIGSFIASLTACNTVKGVGKDTEKAGETIQKEAERHD